MGSLQPNPFRFEVSLSSSFEDSDSLREWQGSADVRQESHSHRFENYVLKILGDW